MTIPSEYQRASVEFERFMVSARDAADLTTTNMAWNMVAGVLFTFRRRLSVEQGLQFAGVLPPVLRALFIDGWDFRSPPLPFGSRESLTEEVKSLRRQHNFSPASSIVSVATALRGCVDVRAFDAVLAELPAGAAEFWAVESPAGAGSRPNGDRVA